VDKDIKIKLWFLFYVNKKQFLLIYITIAVTTLILAALSYYFPPDIKTKTSWFGIFYAKNAVIFWLFINLYTVIEGLFFWNYFYKEQIKIIQTQKEQIEEKNKLLELQNEEIKAQKEEIENQRDLAVQQKKRIEYQNKQIKSSIEYASKIQNAVLPNPYELKNFLDIFILFLPRDIVSGDFYWFSTVKHDNYKKHIIVAADCTGHGVPGAFLSMLGISLLNEIVIIQNIIKPDEILDKLRKEIKKSLHQYNSHPKQQDGMDLSLISIDKQNMQLEYAGANNPIYICRKNNFDIFPSDYYRLMNSKNTQLLEIRPDKMPIGVYYSEKNFSSKILNLQTNDMIYLFSDGYIDQFGGEKGHKLMSINFKKLIIETSNLDFDNQKNHLLNFIEKWKAGYPQIDDIMILGVKI
jgi:serine phosphatase RsbU (regulator of sigma subunit)